MSPRGRPPVVKPYSSAKTAAAQRAAFLRREEKLEAERDAWHAKQRERVRKKYLEKP